MRERRFTIPCVYGPQNRHEIVVMDGLVRAVGCSWNERKKQRALLELADTTDRIPSCLWWLNDLSEYLRGHGSRPRVGAPRKAAINAYTDCLTAWQKRTAARQLMYKHQHIASLAYITAGDRARAVQRRAARFKQIVVNRLLERARLPPLPQHVDIFSLLPEDTWERTPTTESWSKTVDRVIVDTTGPYPILHNTSCFHRWFGSHILINGEWQILEGA